MSAGPSVNLLCSRGTSVNFRQLSVRPRDYLSNFVSAEHSVIFSKHSVPPHDIPSTCVNFFASTGHSVNFLCIHGTFRQLPSTLSASAVPCVKFLSVGHSVNFPFVCGTFRQVSSTLRVSTAPSVNFPCLCETFSQLSVHPRDLQSTSARPRDLPSIFSVA